MKGIYYGCKTCKREFAEGKAPKHERTFMDIWSGAMSSQQCAGVGVNTVKIDRETLRRLK